MEIEHQIALVDDPSRRDMGIGENEVTPGVLFDVAAKASHHVAPAGVIRVPIVHEFDLAEVDGFDSDIDPALAGVNHIRVSSRLMSGTEAPLPQ